MMIIQRLFLTLTLLELEGSEVSMLTWLDSFAATVEETPAEALFLARKTIRMTRPATATNENTEMRAMFLFLVELSSVVPESVVGDVGATYVQAWSSWDVKGKLGS